MKSITIHDLREPLNSLIRKKSKNEGLSLNKTIKKLLEESLGINPPKEFDHKNDFVEFLGVWSDRDVEEFSRATADFEKIDPGDWE